MDPANTSSDVNDASRNTYGEMVKKAISTINDGNGVDIDGICEFIMGRYVVPQDFRKRLRNKLKKLVSGSKLEKVENRYKILGGDTSSSGEAVNPDDSTKPQDLPSTSEETTEMIEAAVKAVAMAENIEFQAKEAYQLEDSMNELLKESHMILQLSFEILELCSNGKKVFLQ